VEASVAAAATETAAAEAASNALIALSPLKREPLREEEEAINDHF